jgi:hypothetical protein
VLFVGVADHGNEDQISGRLIQRGAVAGDIAAPPVWDPAAEAIYILRSGGVSRAGHSWPGLHLAIATDGGRDADVVIDPGTEALDVLWERRLVPFEANLRTGRRAPRRQHAVLAHPDPTWPQQAQRLMERLVADRGAPAAFDAVPCHGVLTGRPGSRAAAGRLSAQVVVPDGIVSVLVRNGDALAMRPGLLGVRDKAGRASDGESYLDRIGVSARLEDLTSALAQPQMAVSRWYGVRVFTGIVASGEPVPGEATLESILRSGERAGRTDPYRHVTALLHLVAVRG